MQNPRELVARFALIVTEQTSEGISCIAKNGDNSLFRTFQRIVPQVQSPILGHANSLKIN
jgi:hypothetical protein